MKKIVSVVLVVLLCLGVSACSKTETNIDLWKNATYTEDTELGEGAKTVLVEVAAEDKSVTFTINSDKSILGDALAEHKLIEGEKGAYGLYVKKVNGIEADYDKNKTYWGFNKNGESMVTGVDAEKISDGNNYEINYITENTSK